MPCRNPFSASRRARTATCISAMRCRRCSISTWRGRPAAGSCCASRTSTRRAAGRNSRRRSIEDLAWLGIAWEQPVRRQSEHFDDYRAALEKLAGACGLTFPSFESRAEIAHMVADRDVRERWPRDPDGVPLYPGAARQMKRAGRGRRASRAASLRASASTWRRRWNGPGRCAGAKPARARPARRGDVAADPAAWGDVVVGRKETPTSYHLAVVVDDALQGVTDVVRGQDLFWSTSVHRVLQALLDLPAPDYHHHRLILDADGKKLSKSTRGHRPARTARAGRDAGRYSQTCERRGVVPAVPAWHASRPGASWRRPGARLRRGRLRKRRARRRDNRARSKWRSPASPTTSARR